MLEMDIHDKQREKNLLTEGKIYFEKGKLQKSAIVLNEVIELNSKSSEAFFLIGNVFHRNGEIGKAIKAFSRVLDLEPSHTDAAISLSVLYNDIGKYEKAKEIFEKAQGQVKAANAPVSVLSNTNEKKISIAVDPHINKKFAYKHFEIADLYMSYLRYDEALFEYNKAIALDPNNLEARVKVSKVYAKKGFVSKAFEELKRLKNEYPTYTPGCLALGILYFSNGKVIEAQTEWQKILEKDSLHEEALMYMRLSESATETSLS